MVVVSTTMRDLARDDSGRLVLTDSTGRRHVGVVPLRTFPISEPNGCIALLTEEGREIAFLESLASLPEEMGDLVRHELACREFVPVIHRIVSTTNDVDSPRWQLETDHGNTDTQVHVDDGLRWLGDQGLLVVDIHGLRFLIPDIAKLDAASRRILDRYL
ncbi:MAG: cyanophycin metabolism-associated DUF1854 family protein [Pirellulaceae bacterium]